MSTLALGAMTTGTRTDEQTSFAILDRYVEAGGTFIDTSNNYAFWFGGDQGGQGEELLGRRLHGRERLGLDRIDLLHAHIEDTTVPLAETVEGFADLAREGTVGPVGVSNHSARTASPCRDSPHPPKHLVHSAREPDPTGLEAVHHRRHGALAVGISARRAPVPTR